MPRGEPVLYIFVDSQHVHESSCLLDANIIHHLQQVVAKGCVASAAVAAARGYSRIKVVYDMIQMALCFGSYSALVFSKGINSPSRAAGWRN